MCGRYALTETPEAVRALMGYRERPNFPPRYNIAPTQPIAVVHNGPLGRAMSLMRWGFVPDWAKDAKDFPTLINARAESAAEKPAFRNAMRHRRCLIPADAFYEWQASGRGRKVPHLVRRPDGGLFAFAGLWETCSDPSGSEIDTVAILTTAANERLKGLHPRMPVVVPPEEFDRWLDTANEPRHVRDLLAAVPDEFFEAFPVWNLVNTVSNDDPAVQAPLADEEDEPAKAGSSQMSLF